MEQIHFTLNGKAVSADVAPNMRLLDLLRGVFGLTGAKEGAADFGASFSRQMNEAMRELGETWNSMTRKDAPAPENSAVGSGGEGVAL